MLLGRTRGRDRARGHSPSPFTPRAVADLMGWWNASVLAGLSDSDPIATLPDGSGNGHDATQGTAAKKPTYRTDIVAGRAVARFDGVDDALTGSSGISAGSAITVIAAVRVNGTNAYGSNVSLGIATGTQEIGLMADAGGGNLAVSNFAGPTATTGDRYTTAPNNTWHIASLVYAPTATPVLYKNGGTALTYTTAVGDWSGVNLNNGANNYPFALGAAAGGSLTPSNVDIAQVAVYSRALSDAERSKLERWLGSIYGVTVT